MQAAYIQQSVKIRRRNVTATVVRQHSSDSISQYNEDCLEDKFHWKTRGSDSSLTNSSGNCSTHQSHQNLLSRSTDDIRMQDNSVVNNLKENNDTKSISLKAMNSVQIDQQSSIRRMGNSNETNIKCTKSGALNVLVEVAVRVALCASLITMERSKAFQRKIHPEEVWLYKNPITKDYVSPAALLLGTTVAPFLLTTGYYLLSRNRKDFVQGNYAFTLAILLNGFMTSMLKISVGRPRPDFFYRCYPDGKVVGDFDHCTGDPYVVNEGRKSFPSGHASMAFAGFGFMFFYLASKLHVFNNRGRGRSWRLCIALAPLILAIEVAISRTCDYHHHWQDSAFGGLMGFCISYLSYRQYFPSIFVENKNHRIYAKTHQSNHLIPSSESQNGDESQPLIESDVDDRWI